jgi:UDP-glucose 4-epimerase
LEFCRKHDIEKIVFTSSAAVYTESLSPLKEDEILEPSSPYGIQKVIVENLIKNYNETYGIPFTIFRLFNVYGPRAQKGEIKNMIDCLKNNKPFHLYGNGNQTRDFIYIKEIKILLVHHKFKNEIVNVGTGKPTSINQLINYVQDMTRIKLKIINHPPIKGEIKKVLWI